jgi:hypothetical protein
MFRIFTRCAPPPHVRVSYVEEGYQTQYIARRGFYGVLHDLTYIQEVTFHFSPANILCTFENVADISAVLCSTRLLSGYCPTAAYRPLLHLLYQILLVPDFLDHFLQSVLSLM